MTSLEMAGTARSATTGEAKALVKGIAALTAIAAAPAGLTLADVAREAGLAKGTAHRLLTSLVAADLVRTAGDGTYRLASGCLALGQAFLEGLDVRAEAAEPMRRVVELTGETCHLGILDGRHIVYIEKLDSPQSIRMVSRVGGTNPATTTGLGKAILAFCEPAVVDDVYADGIPKRTENTVTDAALARAALEEVRRNGFALDDLENELGIRCIAAPILDHDGRAAAGISIAGPEQRVTRESVDRFAAVVREAAEEISRRLGYSGPFPPGA
jgi:IclR family acetate operon transcriptional repressor